MERCCCALVKLEDGGADVDMGSAQGADAAKVGSLSVAHHHDTTKNTFSDLNSKPLCGTTNLYALEVNTGLVKL